MIISEMDFITESIEELFKRKKKFSFLNLREFSLIKLFLELLFKRKE
jgi:hypothetical protein